MLGFRFYNVPRSSWYKVGGWGDVCRLYNIDIASSHLLLLQCSFSNAAQCRNIFNHTPTNILRSTLREFRVFRSVGNVHTYTHTFSHTYFQHSSHAVR